MTGQRPSISHCEATLAWSVPPPSILTRVSCSRPRSMAPVSMTREMKILPLVIAVKM